MRLPELGSARKFFVEVNGIEVPSPHGIKIDLVLGDRTRDDGQGIANVARPGKIG